MCSHVPREGRGGSAVDSGKQWAFCVAPKWRLSAKCSSLRGDESVGSAIRTQRGECRSIPQVDMGWCVPIACWTSVVSESPFVLLPRPHLFCIFIRMVTVTGQGRLGIWHQDKLANLGLSNKSEGWRETASAWKKCHARRHGDEPICPIIIVLPPRCDFSWSSKCWSL